MLFEWDEHKNQTNIAKHGIDFNDAKNVFLDPHRIERVESRQDYGEIRFQTIGMVGGRLLFVVYTYRDENTRIISARRAERHERRKYHESYA